MRFRTILLMTVLVALGAWYGYDRWSTWRAGIKDSPALPVNRVLTDAGGRTVSVKILARDEDEVQFVRLSDNAVFHYPLRSLSVPDQEFLRSFPATTLPPASVPTRASSAEKTTSPESHLRRERGELQHKIALLELELRKRDDPNPKMSRDQIERQLRDHANRIIAIDQELLELAFRARRP